MKLEHDRERNAIWWEQAQEYGFERLTEDTARGRPSTVATSIVRVASCVGTLRALRPMSCLHLIDFLASCME